MATPSKKTPRKAAKKAPAKARTPRPKAERPYMPGYGILGPKEGVGVLPWSWARARLAAARNYFVITTRPGGPPHAQAVWGVLIDDVYYFSTSETSRKARNLARNPACTVAIECDGDETVVLEGIAREERSRAVIKKFVAAYEPKYDWKMDPMPGAVYAVDPTTVFGIGADPFAETATRWTFPRTHRA